MEVVTTAPPHTSLRSALGDPAERLDACIKATCLLIICYGPEQWYSLTACRVVMAFALLFQPVPQRHADVAADGDRYRRQRGLQLDDV